MSATPGNDLPGAFPADATVEGSSHEHNKLHKRDDPRGFTQVDNAPRTQTAGTSGLGSTLADPKSPTNTTGNYTYGGQDAAGEQAGPGVMTGAHSRMHNQGQPTSTEATGAPATQGAVGTIKQDNLDDRAGMSAGHGTAGTTGHESSQIAGHDGSHNESDPYWGDIPRGSGTYNTVVGHGSTEDSHEGHPAHREFPLAHGTRHSDNQGTSATESSLTSGSPTAGQGTYNTVVGHGSAEDNALARDNTTSSAIDPQHKDSHGKEAAAAAGVGAAGAGAYAAHRHHAKDDDTTIPAKTASHDQTEKDSKAGGLFSRGHKDESPKHEKEHHHEKTKEEGDKKILGIFPTRSKKDSEHHEAGTTSATAPHATQDTTTTNPAARTEQESHHGRDAALAGAGVAGAGYAAHKHGEHKDEENSQGLSREESSSSKKSESKLHGLFHRSSNKEKEPKEKESKGRRESLGYNDAPPNAAEYYNGKEASQLAVERERRGKDHGEELPKYGQAQPQLIGLPPQQGSEPVTIATGERLVYGTHNDAGTQDTQREGSHGKEAAAAAGLGATGGGAYAAHKHHENDNEASSPTKTKSHEEKEKSGSKLGGLFSRNKNKDEHKDEYKEERKEESKDKHHKEAAAAATGVGAAGLATGAAHRDDAHRDATHGDAAQPSTTTGAHTAPMGASTTSPMGASTTSPMGASTTTPMGASTISPTDKHHKEAAAAATGLGAAGLAAGAAHRDDTHRDATHPSTTTGAHASPMGASTTSPSGKYDTLSSGTASGMAGTHGGPVDTSSADRSAKYDTLSSGTASGIKGTHAPGERMTDTSSSIYSTEDKPSHGHDNLAYAGAGAAGAGAAAYGAHKAHEHHENKDRLASSTEPTMTSTTTSNPATSSTQRAAEPLSGHNERSAAPIAGAGAGAGAGAAGVGAYAAHKADEHHKASPTTGTHTSTLGRTSQDSSHGGQYNVLSSGTPSGINMSGSPTHSHPQQDSMPQSSAVHDPLTSSSKGLDNSKLAAAGGAAALGGAGAGAYAASRGGNQEAMRSAEPMTSSSTTAPMTSSSTTAPMTSSSTTAPMTSSSTTAPMTSSSTTAPMTSSAAPASTSKSYEDVIASAPERQAAAGSTDADIHGRGLVGGNERKIDTSGADQNLGAASYDNKPTAPTGGATSSAGGLGGAAVGAGAATAAARSAMGHLSKPVTHTCDGCGKENDISKYFKNEEGVIRQ